ncbi:MAG: threonine/serine exporter family protein [Oscillospiraceae bacterium]|nr:threonine/serine exporter family protein [Oscillospiraceae bacterium]
MENEQILNCALDIGEQMLISGAEVGRVEAAIRFICTAYGCTRTDVFTITSSIVVTAFFSDGTRGTQTRRITVSRTDLTKLHRLNALSREICANKPDYGQVQEKLQKICAWTPYPLWLQALGSALIAFSFAIFFGGDIFDGAVASVLGFGLRYLTWYLQKAELNQIFVNVVASFLLSFSTILLVRSGIGSNVNKIIIGNIMLLIPGIALTNSLRDMISGDIMTGMLRFLDAVLVAAAIAAGYILAGQLLGGVV